MIKFSTMKNEIIQEIDKKFDIISTWLNQRKEGLPQIPYCSVDLRESSFKVSSIDTNLFPAGFNNLANTCHSKIIYEIKNYLSKNFNNTSSILLFCEDHTRNKFYLNNIYKLSELISNSGYNVTVSTFFKDHPKICEDTGHITLKTESNKSIKIYCISHIAKKSSQFKFDLCLLNNDLSNGDFSKLTELNIPIVPQPLLGWHNRKKSTHCKHLYTLTETMISDCNLSIDPWLLTSLYDKTSTIRDINNPNDQKQIAKKTEQLLNKIKVKYNEYQIKETPYIILKSETGTYGMGIIKIESAEEISSLNRKKRNKLNKGKSSIPIQHYILQEGIPTIKTHNNSTCEEVVYNTNGNYIGSFYRVHNEKSNKDILNSKGMTFEPLETQAKTSYIISQLANIAAQVENNNL